MAEFQISLPGTSLLEVKLTAFFVFKYCSRIIAAAIKDIKEGEELCTTYILMEDGISKTRDMLLCGWRFNCICPLCNEKDVNLSQDMKNDIEKYMDNLKFSK